MKKREKMLQSQKDKISRSLIINAKNNPNYGNKGKKFTEEHKQNIKIALHKPEVNIKLAVWKNKKLSKKHKYNIGIGNTGKKQTDEHKRKMVETRRKNNSYVFSEKTKDKMSKSHKGNKNGMYGKKHTEKTLKIISNNTTIALSDPIIRNKMILKRAERIIPTKDTSIEVKIQNFLKQLGIDFFTHQYIKEIEHSYQCDILIPSMNLVIECDGNYWHKYPIGKDIDHIRTNELIEKGFKVLRLWEREIRVMNVEDLQNKLDILKNGI